MRSGAGSRARTRISRVSDTALVLKASQPRHWEMCAVVIASEIGGSSPSISAEIASRARRHDVSGLLSAFL